VALRVVVVVVVVVGVNGKAGALRQSVVLVVQ